MFIQLATTHTDSGFVPVRDKKILRERNKAIKRLADSLTGLGIDREEVKSLYKIVERK